MNRKKILSYQLRSVNVIEVEDLSEPELTDHDGSVGISNSGFSPQCFSSVSGKAHI